MTLVPHIPNNVCYTQTHQQSCKVIKTHQQSCKVIKTHQQSCKVVKTHQKSWKGRQNSSVVIQSRQTATQHHIDHQKSWKVVESHWKSANAQSRVITWWCGQKSLKVSQDLVSGDHMMTNTQTSSKVVESRQKSLKVIILSDSQVNHATSIRQLIPSVRNACHVILTNFQTCRPPFHKDILKLRVRAWIDKEWG